MKAYGLLLAFFSLFMGGCVLPGPLEPRVQVPGESPLVTCGFNDLGEIASPNSTGPKVLRSHADWLAYKADPFIPQTMSGYGAPIVPLDLDSFDFNAQTVLLFTNFCSDQIEFTQACQGPEYLDVSVDWVHNDGIPLPTFSVTRAIAVPKTSLPTRWKICGKFSEGVDGCPTVIIP